MTNSQTQPDNQRRDEGASQSRVPAQHISQTPFVKLLPYQRAAIRSQARFRWSCWARQTGKSFTLSLRRILRGLHRRRNQIFLSAGERQSRELMQKARQHLQTLEIAARHTNETFLEGTRYKQLEITLPNGVRIIALPAKPETIRGFTGDVFLDEFAMHADDRAIWAAIFPTLLRGDGELDIASTPKGKSNIFYDISKNNRFERTTLTLPDAVNQGLKIDSGDIRSSMADEELYRQEFLCEFLDEATALLTYDQIARCEDPTLDKDASFDQLAESKYDLYLGLDVGRRRDLTVFWLLERTAKNRFRTAAIRELANAPFREQFNLLCQFMALPKLRRCAIDAGGIGMNLAESALEQFGHHRVEPVTFTTPVKSHLAGSLRIAVEEATIAIPVAESIRNDFHSLERTVTPTGHFRLDAAHSKTGHADRFWAAALAFSAADRAAENAAPHPESMNAKPIAFAHHGTW